jgi:tetratricopeptide (TPR) repeat protein
VNRSGTCALGAILVAAAAAVDASPVDDAVADVQREWERISYTVPPAQRAERFEALAARAHAASAAHPDRPEPMIWEGIVMSSWAGAKGGLGALPLVRQAKGLYESAIALRPEALEGSALNSLGVLYYKVPGWPVAFGDKARAQELLKRGLTINPTGIDPNYFYGEFLVETGRAAEAVPFLERALKAPARPGREIADAGRRDEALALLAKARSQTR